MRSLRRRLLISLWATVSIVAFLAAAIAYHQVNHEAKELLDNQLQQIAQTIATQKGNRPPPAKDDDDPIEVAVWGADGLLRYASSTRPDIPLRKSEGFTEMILAGKPYRLYTEIIGGSRFEIAQTIDTREDQAEAAALAVLAPLLVLLPVLAVIIALVIRSLLQPVRSVAAALAQRGSFDGEALPISGLPVEVAPLVEEINRLLKRHSEAIVRERQFVADAAHALRTPLAALQLQADVLDGSSDPLERAARLTDLRAGIARSASLSNQLLSLARIEGTDNAACLTIPLGPTLLEIQTLYQPCAAARGITLRADVRSAAEVRGDLSCLMLICGNLLDNALRHSPTGGQVDLIATVEDEAARIEVSDMGPGLGSEQLERVFERFYRAPGQAGTGSGLGLASVKTLVTQLGGRVSLHNRTDRSGLVARVYLPVVEGCRQGADDSEAESASCSAGPSEPSGDRSRAARNSTPALPARDASSQARHIALPHLAAVAERRAAQSRDTLQMRNGLLIWRFALSGWLRNLPSPLTFSSVARATSAGLGRRQHQQSTQVL